MQDELSVNRALNPATRLTYHHKAIRRAHLFGGYVRSIFLMISSALEIASVRTDWNGAPPDPVAADETPASDGSEGMVKLLGIIGAMAYFKRSIECVIMSFTAVMAAILA